MSEERSAKLKLKRKKCVTTAQGGQEVAVRLQPSSALNSRQDFTGSWFDEIELTAAEQIWKQVLSSVHPDLRNAGWGAVPSLPDVNLKMSRKEEEMIETEVFKVGDMNFEWFPLPTALTIDNAKKPCVAEVEDNQQNIEHFKKPSPDALPENVRQTKSTVLLTKQVDIPVYSKDSKRKRENLPTPQNGSTKNTLLPQTSENVAKPRKLLKGSSRNIKEPQILQKDSSKNAKELLTSQKGSTKHTKEQQTSQKPKINLWATVTSLKGNKTIQDHKGTEEPGTEEKPQPSHVTIVNASKEETSEGSSRGHKIKESAEVSADATSSLDKCPICLLQFPNQFSQLDMDSHLAQCLSETTVDIVW